MVSYIIYKLNQRKIESCNNCTDEWYFIFYAPLDRFVTDDIQIPNYIYMRILCIYSWSILDDHCSCLNKRMPYIKMRIHLFARGIGTDRYYADIHGTSTNFRIPWYESSRLFHPLTRTTSSGCLMLHKTVNVLWNLYGNPYKSRAEKEEETGRWCGNS